MLVPQKGRNRSYRTLIRRTHSHRRKEDYGKLQKERRGELDQEERELRKKLEEKKDKESKTSKANKGVDAGKSSKKQSGVTVCLEDWKVLGADDHPTMPIAGVLQKCRRRPRQEYGAGKSHLKLNINGELKKNLSFHLITPTGRGKPEAAGFSGVCDTEGAGDGGSDFGRES
ncbi:keratin [Striga asiatica]|uniref:Keratin n=1 Tax=Striga asiatica TaxID=4170 RepID=A0A5A7PL45_STRAF|nr:keratin [Striga asiatica]